MDNEIEQLAEQHGMTVEFVTWFFNEKKAGCGNVWFMMLAAMWEGWKGRGAELTAALATLEKCREVSGCPEGLDLQDHLRQLAAENVGLKGGLEWLYETVSSECVCIPDEKYSSVTNAAQVLNETPATDRIVAEAEARGVEKAIECIVQTITPNHEKILKEFAQQLHEGAK